MAVLRMLLWPRSDQFNILTDSWESNLYNTKRWQVMESVQETVD